MSSTLPEGDVIVSNATEPTTAMLIVKWAYPFLENLSYCAAATISPQQAGQYSSPRPLRQFSADSALTLIVFQIANYFAVLTYLPRISASFFLVVAGIFFGSVKMA